MAHAAVVVATLAIGSLGIYTVLQHPKSALVVASAVLPIIGAALWSDRFKPLASNDRRRVLELADLVIQEKTIRSEIAEELKEKWGFEIELFVRNQPRSGYIPDLVGAAGLEDQEMLELGRICTVACPQERELIE